ncbi:MAG: polysaccharide deacetylase family protein [Cytophagales bacterium]
MSNLLFDTLYYSGLTQLSRKILSSKRSLILMFHGVYKIEHESIPESYHFGMSESEFIKVLSWIKAESLSIISLKEVLEGKKGIHLSFDDGYSNNFHNVLPILEDFNFCASIFISSQHLRTEKQEGELLDLFKNYVQQIDSNMPGLDDFILDNWTGLNQKELQALFDSSLIEIGSHTHSHPYLSQLDKKGQEIEIEKGQTILKEILGESPKYFSYPFGDYNSSSIEIVNSMGFDCALAVNSKKLNLNQPLLELPRLGIYSSENNYLSLKLSYLTKTIK